MEISGVSSIPARRRDPAPRRPILTVKRLVIGAALVATAARLIVGFVSCEVGCRKSGESSAIGALRTIARCQALFREGDREGDGVADYASSLTELSEVGLIDGHLGSGRKTGYAYSLSGGEDEWQCSATPIRRSAGFRNFIVCTDAIVRFSVPSKGPATGSSPPLE